MDNLTPRQIVAELDKYIIGQRDAKKAVAIALRNRWRRRRLLDDLRDEVLPKNILMIGPTGVGKTEVARRLARLADAPFVKVEASKFTEVGYVGRDVESMVRDLAEVAIKMVREEQMAQVQEKARANAEERLLDYLMPAPPQSTSPRMQFSHAEGVDQQPQQPPYQDTREKLRQQLRDGKLEERTIEVETREKSMPFGMVTGAGMEDLEINLKEMLGNLMPDRTKRRKVKVAEARAMLVQEEAARLIDPDRVAKDAIERAEQLGIIFIDEIDKIASRGGGGHGPDVSREGVQRDLLPIVEGSTVTTKHGAVRTEHILFVAAGAFHTAKPSDLIPELQGRFPIRVELSHLCKEDFVRILTEPSNALTKQYCALMATEEVTIDFTPEAIEELASIATTVNDKTENIGARRLHTVLEKLLEEISFEAPECKGTSISITPAYVRERLGAIVKDEDLSRYIL